MNRREFLASVACLAAGCTRSSGPIANPTPATATPSSEDRTSLGRMVVGKHLDFDRPPECELWDMFSDGSATQLAPLPAEVFYTIPGHGDPQNRVSFFDPKTRSLGMISFKAKGQFQIKRLPALPKDFQARMMLFRRQAVVASSWDKLLIRTTTRSFEEPFSKPRDIREWGASDNYFAVMDLDKVGTFYRWESDTPIKLFDHDFSGDFAGGYGLGISFCEQGNEVLVSAGLMETDKGDPMALYRLEKNGLKPLQVLDTGFRPSALHFLPQRGLAFVQDHAGDLYAAKKGAQSWSISDKLELAANDNFARLATDQRTVFSKNNAGDVLYTRLSDEGKWASPVVFQDFLWRQPGRKPQRIQFDIRAIIGS